MTTEDAIRHLNALDYLEVPDYDDARRTAEAVGVVLAALAEAWRERDRLIAAAPEMLAELQRLEWIVGGGFHYCPSCDHVYAAGHAPDCRLAAVLAKTTGEHP